MLQIKSKWKEYRGYILEEIRLKTRIRNLNIFMNFLDIVSFCQGEIINFSHISRDCGVSSKTVQSHFELLVDMLLGCFIHPCIKKNKRNLIMQAPKFYLFDVGIANHLAKRHITALQGSGAGYGALLVFRVICLFKIQSHRFKLAILDD